MRCGPGHRSMCCVYDRSQREHYLPSSRYPCHHLYDQMGTTGPLLQAAKYVNLKACAVDTAVPHIAGWLKLCRASCTSYACRPRWRHRKPSLQQVCLSRHMKGPPAPSSAAVQLQHHAPDPCAQCTDVIDCHIEILRWIRHAHQIGIHRPCTRELWPCRRARHAAGGRAATRRHRHRRRCMSAHCCCAAAGTSLVHQQQSRPAATDVWWAWCTAGAGTLTMAPRSGTRMVPQGGLAVTPQLLLLGRRPPLTRRPPDRLC